MARPALTSRLPALWLDLRLETSDHSAVEAEPQPHGRLTLMLLTAFLLAS